MLIAIITMARKDSKRFPKKNILPLNNKPLIEYTLEIMKQFDLPKYTITDDSMIKQLSQKYNIPVIDEPKHLADDNFNLDELMRWMHSQIKADYYFLLPPTAPIRDFKEIKNYLDICLESGVNTAYTLKKINNAYSESGLFFYFHKDYILNLKNDDSLIFIDKLGIDIDTYEDFKIAERELNEN